MSEGTVLAFPAEEKIRLQLIQKFNLAQDKIKITRARRIFCEIDYAIFPQVLEYLFRELKFIFLCSLTGFDEGEKLAVMYHLAQEREIMVNVKVVVDKSKPVIKTVTHFYPCADVYEREIVDLLGFVVEGLPPGNRYPLTDDWPQGEYPLRKDWKPKK